MSNPKHSKSVASAPEPDIVELKLLSGHNDESLENLENLNILNLSSMVTAMGVELNIFMNKLAKINPEPKMLGEIEYWHFMAEKLKPAKKELDSSKVQKVSSLAIELAGKVKMAAECMTSGEAQFSIDITKEEHKLVKSVDQFTKQRDRLLKGYKEALWNDKYMKLIYK